MGRKGGEYEIKGTERGIWREGIRDVKGRGWQKVIKENGKSKFVLVASW